jgi:hypothetical protein
MRVSDPDGKLEDLVFGQRHVKAVEVEERSEQDNGCAFVAFAKGVVRCDAPEQSGCLSEMSAFSYAAAFCGRANADSSRPRSSTAAFAWSTETSTASA